MRISIALIAAILLLTAVPHAASASDQEQARELMRGGAIVPLERITAQVRQRNIGEILEVELESRNGVYHYEVEVVDATGAVRKLLYDAATGWPLGVAKDD